MLVVAWCSSEGLNVISYFFSQRFFYSCLSVTCMTGGHIVGRKLLTGCGDLANSIFFMGANILISSGRGFVQVRSYYCAHDVTQY